MKTIEIFSVVVFILSLFFSVNLLADEKADASFLIEVVDVKSFQGNYVVSEPAWDNLGVLHGTHGSATWQLEIEREDDYSVQAFYASPDSRAFP